MIELEVVVEGWKERRRGEVEEIGLPLNQICDDAGGMCIADAVAREESSAGGPKKD